MNVDTMRTIDRNVGIPLTFLLTLWRWLWDSIMTTQQHPGKKIKKILFIELSEMGSTILVDPALRKARQQLDAELFFVIFAKNRGSLDLTGTIQQENTFTIRESGIFVLLLDTLRFLRWSHQEKIDTVVDLELFSRFTARTSGTGRK